MAGTGVCGPGAQGIWRARGGSFLGAWLWNLSPQVNFLVAAVCGALGTIWFWWFVYRREPEQLSQTG